MTNNYKMKLLSWFTGNYTIDPQPTTINTFEESIDKVNDDIIDVMGNDAEILNGVQITSPNGNNSTWLVLLVWNNTTKKGGFVLLDENFTQQAIITQYDSGVDIGRIDNLQVDEQGRIYGVEIRPDEERIRFVYLTNFLVKINGEFKLDLRKAYNLPITWSRFSYMYNKYKTYIFKIPNVSKYCIILKTDQDDGISAEVYDIFTMEISTEQSNKFKYARIIPPSQAQASYKPFVKWNSNKLFTIDTISLNSRNEPTSSLIRVIVEEKSEYTDDTWWNTTTKIITLDSTINIGKDGDCYCINENTLLVTDITTVKLYFSLIEINDTTGTVTFVKDYTVMTNNFQSIFTESNGYLYCYTCCSNGTNQFEEAVYHILDKTENITGDDFIKEVLYSTQWGEFPNYFGTKFFTVQNMFNLYKYYTCHKDGDDPTQYDFKIQREIYNENNYNGTVYSGLNSLIGNQGLIYNSEGLVFARNLYNKVIQSNKTTYSVEIPNNMLNDYALNIQELLSETKNVMNNNNNPIIKNIYEELIINFINKITISNEIDETKPIYYLNGATRLNDSISNLKDYNNSKMTKYRINYSDNTSEIGTLTITQVNLFKYTLNLSIEVEKEITSIDFISNDENTIYNTITPTLELNKTYNLSVDVHIE